jgi:hypothetical protein
LWTAGETNRVSLFGCAHLYCSTSTNTSIDPATTDNFALAQSCACTHVCAGIFGFPFAFAFAFACAFAFAFACAFACV